MVAQDLDGRSMRRWSLLFRIVVALLLVSTIAATSSALLRPVAFRAAFPGATGGMYVALLGVSIAGGVSLLGLWFWRRWAIWVFALVGITAIVVDVVVSAPVRHQFAVAVSTALVLALAWRILPRFGAGRTP